MKIQELIIESSELITRYHSIEAAINAINKAKTPMEIKQIVHASEYIIKSTPYNRCADFYLATDKRFKLILDSTGDGAYAAKVKKMLDEE